MKEDVGKASERLGMVIRDIADQYKENIKQIVLALDTKSKVLSTPTYENMSRAEAIKSIQDATKPYLIKHIENYSKDKGYGMDGWVMSQLSNKIGTATGVKGFRKEEFTKDIDKTKEISKKESEIDKIIKNLDQGTEVYNEKEIVLSKIKRDLKLTNQELDIVKTQVGKARTTVFKKGITPKTIVKGKPTLFKNALEKEFSKELFKIVKTKLNKMPEGYRKFITSKKGFDLVRDIDLEIMSNSLKGKGEGFRMFIEPVLDASGKQKRMSVDEANAKGIPLDKGGSGPAIWKKKNLDWSNKDIKKQYTDWILDKIDFETGKAKETPRIDGKKDAISKALAQQLGKDAVISVSKDPYVRTKNKKGEIVQKDLLPELNSSEKALLKSTTEINILADKIGVSPNVSFSTSKEILKVQDLINKAESIPEQVNILKNANPKVLAMFNYLSPEGDIFKTIENIRKEMKVDLMDPKSYKESLENSVPLEAAKNIKDFVSLVEKKLNIKIDLQKDPKKINQNYIGNGSGKDAFSNDILQRQAYFAPFSKVLQNIANKYGIEIAHSDYVLTQLGQGGALQFGFGNRYSTYKKGGVTMLQTEFNKKLVWNKEGRSNEKVLKEDADIVLKNEGTKTNEVLKDVFPGLSEGIVKTKIDNFYQKHGNKSNYNELLFNHLKGDVLLPRHLKKAVKNGDITINKAYNRVFEANKKLRDIWATEMFDVMSKANPKELPAIITSFIRHMQIQTNNSTGISKGTFTITSATLERGQIDPRTGKRTAAEHQLQLLNFHYNYFKTALDNLGNKQKFLSEYESISKNAEQAIIPEYVRKLNEGKQLDGKVKGNTEFAEGYTGTEILSMFNFMQPGVAEKMLYLKADKPMTIAEFINNKVKTSTSKELLKNYGEIASDLIRISNKETHKNEYKKAKENLGKILESSGLNFSKSQIKKLDTEGILKKIKNIDKAIELARDKTKEKKGISVLDFDDTVAKTKSKVIVYAPAFKPGTSREVSMKLTPAEFAKRHAELERMGASFDFSEFNKVIKGKKGPLFDKLQKAVNKFGNENVFILTARPKESAAAIQAFLEGMGVKLKIENISGLEDGRPIAKAQWIVDRAAEGYNDFYFADDVYKNVKAVQKVLDIIDVKGKVQQAIAFSKSKLNKNINKMIEYSTGIGREKTYSAAKAGLTGKGRSHWKLYMPSRASDFHSLTNALIGKGVKGLKNRKWIQENLVKPFSRGDLAFNTERRTKLADYFVLRNQLKETGSKYRDMFKKNPLNNSIEKGEVWTNQHAVRVYNWAKQGVLPKDISKTDAKKLVDHVNNNPKLKAFAEELVNLHKGEGYPEPREMWLSETITQDILLGGKKTSRNKHMKEFIENADIVFSPENLNKMEAAFGKAWRTAMENNLEAMKTGSNRPSWGEGNKWESDFLDWVNGSVGSTMFINVRSALLQQVSLTNYVNVTDNNIFAAGKAFANNKQFRKDYINLMSDKWSLNRRDGLRYNVQEAEIAELFATTRNKPAALINWALKKGFILTKFMDSHATAFGGASFYRNRTNTYLKQVNPGTGKKYTKQEAENKAKEDWREMSDATQQTSRMDRVSPEQRSVTGRLVLPFSTVQLAYGRRYIDDAARDLINKRYDHLHKGENSALKKIGQIIYGTAIQGAVFHGLQQAIFKVIFDDGNTLDGEELEVANAILDGILVGSGIAGKAVAVFKNWAIAMEKESKKKNPQYTDTATEFLKISPPIDKKYRQFKGALRELQYNMDDIDELSLNNPALNATTKIIESVTNAPVDNLLINMQNVEAALEEDRANWQRPFLIGGWSLWNLEDDKKIKKKSSKFKKFKTKKFK